MNLRWPSALKLGAMNVISPGPRNAVRKSCRGSFGASELEFRDRLRPENRCGDSEHWQAADAEPQKPEGQA